MRTSKQADIGDSALCVNGEEEAYFDFAITNSGSDMLLTVTPAWGRRCKVLANRAGD